LFFSLIANLTTYFILTLIFTPISLVFLQIPTHPAALTRMFFVNYIQIVNVDTLLPESADLGRVPLDGRVTLELIIVEWTHFDHVVWSRRTITC
jgi:hypothetical protein